MDSKHVGRVTVILLIFSFTVEISVAAESPATAGDVAIDVPDTHRQVGQNNSTGLSELNLTVVIDNRTVADGDTITADDNPTLIIRVDGSASTDLSVIHVDGDSRRTYTPNNTVANETTVFDVDTGEYALEVLVQSNGRITAHRATITEDPIVPAIVFSLPFRTGNVSIYDRLENSYTINRSQIQLDGTLHDRSDVEQIAIELRYHRQGIDAPQGLRKRVVTDDPSVSISKSFWLGPFSEQMGAGQNGLKITALDSRGHCRRYNVNLYVEDEDPPSIETLDQRLIDTRSAIRSTIRVTDQVGIHSVGVRRGPANGSGLNYEI